MRILVCATEYYPRKGGVAKVAHRVVENLEKKGVECVICSPTGPDIKLGNDFLIRKTGRFAIFHYWSQVNKYLKKHASEYDLIWLHNPLFLGNFGQKNVLVTMHTTLRGYMRAMRKTGLTLFQKMYYNLMLGVESFAYKKLARQGLMFSADSKEVVRELTELGIKKENIVYVSNGVETSVFRPYKNKNFLHKNLRIPKKDKILISVGRLGKQKQPLLLLEAFKRLKRVYPNVTLLLVGEGELKNQMIDKIKKEKIKGVRCLGFVRHEKLPEILSSADCFIMSSIYEGQPLALLEAMSCGIPVIVSDIPVLREFVEQSKTGAIVDFNSNTAAKKIADYLKKKVDNDKVNVRKFILDGWDWKDVAERYLREMKKIAFKNEN
jgi:glycosyltransferase involved in cell wall biosynthesis